MNKSHSIFSKNVPFSKNEPSSKITFWYLYKPVNYVQGWCVKLGQEGFAWVCVCVCVGGGGGGRLSEIPEKGVWRKRKEGKQKF